MALVVGIDVQRIHEVAASIAEFGSRYTGRLFTDRELEDCVGSSTVTARRLAGLFSAKEAVLKILDTLGSVPSWRSIEIHPTAKIGHQIALSGEAAELARRQGIERWSLSLSCGADIASAAVVARVTRQKFEGNR